MAQVSLGIVLTKSAVAEFIDRFCFGPIFCFIGIEKIHDEAHILHMAVDPAFRRQGIGKLMLEEALKTDASKFILEVRESNSPARSLYESFGFKEAYRRKKYYNDNDEDALVMIYEKKPA